jgi:hypothetical protein
MSLTIDGQANSITSSTAGVNIPATATVATLSVGPSGSYMTANSIGVGIGTTTTNSRQLSIAGGGVLGTQVEIRGIVDAAGISLFSTKNYEIQSTKSNEANYPSSFIVYDRDNNGYRLIVDGSGRVTMPYQPAFFAYGGSTPSPGNVYVFTSTRINRGSNYSTSTGRFTAPITGIYLLSAQIFVSSTGATQANLTSNIGLGIELKANTTEGAYNSHSAAGIFSLAANDYAYLQWNQGSTLVGESYTFFCGYLLG